jgi:hypothetical protein
MYVLFEITQIKNMKSLIEVCNRVAIDIFEQFR